MAQTDPSSSDLEQTLQAAITTGSLVDLRTRQPERDDLAHGDRWEPSRTIRAETLIDLLTGPDLTQGTRRPRALRLAGAKITGTLDLQAAELLCPVTLQSCWFEHPVKLVEATGSSLRLPGCHLPALDGGCPARRGTWVAAGRVIRRHPPWSV
jgi:hypothetical protein